MLDKIQLWLKSKIGQPYAYYITCSVYLISMFSGLFIVGYIFNVWWQVLLMGTLMSIMRSYTMGFHCHTNGKCFIISSIILVIFSLIEKTIPIWVVFLLCLKSCTNIYKNSPIELNNEYIDKDEEWHFKRVISIMIMYLIASLITYYFNLLGISRCIMLTLVIVDLLLFKNDKEYI